MAVTEEQTRQEIIDKKLERSGWDLKDPTQVSQEFDIITDHEKANRVKDSSSEEIYSIYEGHQFADYLLLAKNQTPLAVVEAKRTSKDAQLGQEQALQYATYIKKNTGCDLPFIFYTNGHEIFFWDKENYPPIKVYGFPTRDDLERMRFLCNERNELSSELINTNIAGRPYQIEAIKTVLEQLEAQKRRFLLVMATGTGKTRTVIALIDALMRARTVQRVLFLVDRVALGNQALDDFKEYLPNSPVWPKQGEQTFSKDRRIYVTTYPTMLNMIEKGNQELSPFFFDLIVADESHRSIYNVYKNVLDYFYAIKIGLTATPTARIEHDTFQLFECEPEEPTYAYTYEQALSNIPPYLSDFEVLKVRSKFQVEGIKGEKLPQPVQKKLIEEGKDVEDIDFEGSELERKVTNSGTNRLIIREFMEECQKDSFGILPGKSIIFAISKSHARRLAQLFDEMYPEYKGELAKVIVSDDSRVHGKGGLLDQFKNETMPRIAISVDMLDTGIDVREIVNLVFAKPVYSFTKFWQMIGRGTRVLHDDVSKRKSWCLDKDKFLIIDCWDNFEYFKMKPKGVEPGTLTPLPVRLFRAYVEKLQILKKLDSEALSEKVITKLKSFISSLPENNVVVLDNRAIIDETTKPGFWSIINDKTIKYLDQQIAPIMRVLSGVDFKNIKFEKDVVDLSIAILKDNKELVATLNEEISGQIAELPLEVNVVAKEKELIQKYSKANAWMNVTEDHFESLITQLGPLMRFRQKLQDPMMKLDVVDLLSTKEFVEFGPEHERISTAKYREKIEAYIKQLEDDNLVIQKIKAGEKVSDEELTQLKQVLASQELEITEEKLKQVYDNKHANFEQFIKHILGLEKLESWTGTVSHAFDHYIVKHNNIYTAKQIQFIQTLKTYILRTGKLNKEDLLHDPFTQLHPRGVQGLFQPSEIKEILVFADQLVGAEQG